MYRAEAEQSRWIWLIMLSGLALRLFGLADESLWLDEAITAGRVYESAGQILFGWDSETQGPLYYLWVKAWGLTFGADEWMLRIWSVVWGTLAIWYTYQLGRQLFTATGAMLAALFMAVHPFAIHYSQEARPYGLFLCLAAASYYYLLKLMRQHSWPAAPLYVLATAAAFYTHAFGVFLIFSHLLIYWRFREEPQYHGSRRYPRPYLYTLIILFILCVPEIVQNVLAALDKISGDSPAGWIPVPTVKDLLKLPLEYFMNFTVGWIVLPLATLLALFRVATEPQLRLGFQWLVIVAVCFWLLPWIASLAVTPIFVVRYTMPGLLVIIFLMSSSTATLQALPRTLFALAILGLTMFPLWDYYTKVDKDPWRQTAEYLAARAKPGDAIFNYPSYTQDALRHYLPVPLRAQYVRPKSTEELERALANRERVWIVTSYPVSPRNGEPQLKMLREWGSELRHVAICDGLDMNPNAFWYAPISVELREMPAIFSGPEMPPTPDS
ncbi:MAG: glycosyltransferase family 39 protein [bacterium]|nr:glycosyltransferase family 39 protein [bacterium]